MKTKGLSLYHATISSQRTKTVLESIRYVGNMENMEYNGKTGAEK